MLKVIRATGIWFSVMFMVFGFASTNLANKPEKLIVVCTTSVILDRVEEVGKSLIEVISIVPPGICPAHYDIKPSDIRAVGKASLVLSQGIEPWLNDLIKASGNKNLKKISVEGSTVPTKVIEEIRVIGDTLCKVNPENTSYYKENTHRLINSIEETAKKIKEKAKQLQIERYKVICIKWQEDFVKWVGFNVIKTYLPPERISLKEALELFQIGKEFKVSIVVDNLQSGTYFGSKLSREIGATHIVLTNFPGSFPETETYTKMLNYNANQLFNALKN